MNDLQIFENPEFGQVRTVEINGTNVMISGNKAERHALAGWQGCCHRTGVQESPRCNHPAR